MKTKHNISFSSPDKVMYPDNDYTKEDILEYYDRVAEHMLPHLEDRPLMMQRFPDGIEEDGFYQKNASDYFPDWIRRCEVDKEEGTVKHVICDSKDTLLYLVNQGTISFHSWLSTADHLHKPDKMIIDLDPSGDDFSQVQDAARALRNELDRYEITSFPMTTGSRGLHIIIRLDGKEDFDLSRDAARMLGNRMSEKYPGIFTMEQYKKDREGRLYFDIQRNAYAQTGIVPFSLRPRPGAPVATPLEWNEATDSKLQADKYRLNNLFRRLGQTDNYWESYNRAVYSASGLREKWSKDQDTSGK